MDHYLRKENRREARHEVEAWGAVFRESPHDLKGLSREKITTLVNALRLHQVELELQNNELRRIQLELQAARDEYLDLFDFSPVGYITTSADGIILRANMTASTLLCEERTAMAGETLSKYISKEAQDLFYFQRKKIFETNAARTCELAMVKTDGSRFDAQLDSILVADAHGDFTQIRTAVSDISERKRMEKSLRKVKRSSEAPTKWLPSGPWPAVSRTILIIF